MDSIKVIKYVAVLLLTGLPIYAHGGITSADAARVCWEATQAEDALRVAKNSVNRTGQRAVRDAQAVLDAARAMRCCQS